MKKILIFHPFIFGLFPALYIYSQRKEILLESLLVPAMVIFLTILLFWLLLSIVIKEKERMALGLSIFLIFFFSFGYAYKIFRELLPGLGENGYLVFFLLWLVTLVIGIVVIMKRNRRLSTLTLSFSVMGGTLILFLLFDLFPISSWFGYPYFQPEKDKESLVKIRQKEMSPQKEWPNIYYIILDGYGRADILKEFYQFDNQDFIHFLKQRGFFVVEKSRSNYPQTALSLSSSLNFHYIDQLLIRMNLESDNREPLAKLIRDNLLFYHLKQFNYSIITFASGKSETEIKNGDAYLFSKGTLSEFHNLLINSTPLPLILKGRQYQSHRDRILFIFQELEKLPKGNSPFAVFTHIIAPHPPFVFGETGEPVQPSRNFSLGDGDHFTRNASRTEYREGYKKEVIFLNKRLKEMIRNILANSSIPPIIILQSDHGPGSYLEWRNPENSNLRERMSNFIACFLPGSKAPPLSPTLTPVNIFRIVLNQYLQGNYPLLKDEIYFSSLGRPYKMVKVTERTE